MRERLRRREFLRTSSLVIASAALPLGCQQQLSNQSVTVAGADMAPVADAIGYIPHFLETKFDALIQAVRGNLLGGAPQLFQPGQYLEQPPSGWRGSGDTTVSGGVLRAFQQAKTAETGDVKPLYSPLIAQQPRTARRYMQLGERGAQYHSLVGGAQGAFWVQHRWLRWLVERDTCDLTVAGHTLHEPCGFDGDGLPACPVHVTKQMFVELSGKPRSLMFTLGKKPEYPDETWSRHVGHSKEDPGCGPSLDEPDEAIDKPLFCPKG